MKIIVQFKGSSKSGNYGHKGIPGHVGGSAPKGSAPAELTSEQRLAWRDAVNMALYTKLSKTPHGDRLLDVADNVIWGNASRESFSNRFAETSDIPAIAKRNKGNPLSDENVLYEISNIVKDHGINHSQVIDVSEIKQRLHASERELDSLIYRRNMDKYFHWERTYGLDQWRIQGTRYSPDPKNGVVTNETALNKALKAAGYKSPEAFYDKILSLRPA